VGELVFNQREARRIRAARGLLVALPQRRVFTGLVARLRLSLTATRSASLLRRRLLPRKRVADMPMVGGKKYPYTPAGKAAAKKAAAKQKPMKKAAKKRGK
jgi:hypothetical protein